MGEETFRQAFLVHGQGIHMEILNALFNGGKKVFVHPLFHVADGDIRVGAFAGLHDLHGEIHIADSPSD